MIFLNSKYKYKAKRTAVDGKVFASKKEARRYSELKLLEQQGKISDLRCQVKFVLFPTQKDDTGKIVEKSCSYIADFVYYENGRQIVEDVKGVKTPLYIMKRKAMLYFHNVQIRET